MISQKTFFASVAAVKVLAYIGGHFEIGLDHGSARCMLQEVTNNDFKWLNATKPTNEFMNALGAEFHFHELNIMLSKR